MNRTAAAPQPETTPSRPRLFPLEGSDLGKLTSDPAFRASFHARLKSGNRFVVAFYRLGLLPLLGAGRSILLIITKGRVRAKPRFFPVGYHRIGGNLHVFSAWGKQSNWYKNVLASPDDVSVQIGFRRIPVRVEVLDDPAEATRVLRRFIAESPAWARQLIGWDPSLDRVETADFSRMLQGVMIARFLKR